MMKKSTGLLLACLALGQGSAAAAEELAAATYGHYVNTEGAISLPTGFRLHWTHLGSWLVADPKAAGHGFHDVYTQPAAAQAYLQTGSFPDGTILVKEIRQIGTAAMTTGQAQWATAPAIWFVMVKNTEGRFAGNAHWGQGWGWALFKAEAPEVNLSKSFAETCQGCHTPAQKTDWVFIEGYPTLRALEADGSAATLQTK